jgi:prepilin-type N-terminal cleavage/methylation domain-containing protein
VSEVRRFPARLATGHCTAKASRGFTLIELLTVIAITAILAATAIPSFNRMIVGGRVSEAGNSLRSGLELARSEATTRSVRVGICRSGNANAGAPTCSAGAEGAFAGTDWAVGWIVYAKADANAGDVFENGDVLLRRQDTLGGAQGGERIMVFNWNGLRIAGPAGTFAIDHGPPLAALPATLAADQASCLGVNVAGRLQYARPVGGVCP